MFPQSYLSHFLFWYALPCCYWHEVKLWHCADMQSYCTSTVIICKCFNLIICPQGSLQCNTLNVRSPWTSHPSLPGVLQAGALFLLLLSAQSAGAPSGPDPPGLPEGPGAPAAPRGDQPHPQDGAGVWNAGRPRCKAADGAGEESQKHQELGLCVMWQVLERDGVCVKHKYINPKQNSTCSEVLKLHEERLRSP